MKMVMILLAIWCSLCSGASLPAALWQPIPKPLIAMSPIPTFSQVHDMAWDPLANTVYIGGSFQRGLAAYNVANGTTRVTPELTLGPEVRAVTVANNVLYVGGFFTGKLAQFKQFDAPLLQAPVFPTGGNNTIMGGQAIYAVEPCGGSCGNGVIVGGDFTAVGFLGGGQPDTAHKGITRFSGGLTRSNTPLGTGLTNQVYAIHYDSMQDIIYAGGSMAAGHFQKYDSLTGIWTAIGGIVPASGFSAVWGFAPGTDNSLYVYGKFNPPTGKIVKFDIGNQTVSSAGDVGPVNTAVFGALVVQDELVIGGTFLTPFPSIAARDVNTINQWHLLNGTGNSSLPADTANFGYAGITSSSSALFVGGNADDVYWSSLIHPTPAPTVSPTRGPSLAPTRSPTGVSSTPTSAPTLAPTAAPVDPGVIAGAAVGGVVVLAGIVIGVICLAKKLKRSAGVEKTAF